MGEGYNAGPRAAPQVPGPARLAGPDARTSTHRGRGAAFGSRPPEGGPGAQGGVIHEEKQMPDTLGTKYFPKLLQLLLFYVSEPLCITETFNLGHM